MSKLQIAGGMTLAALVFFHSSAHAQTGGGAAGPSTIWSFLGIPQGLQQIRDVTSNRRGNNPQRERTPPLKRIADPENLSSDNPAIKSAAEIKEAEDQKQQKIKAIKYLASIGCGCYDKDGKVTDALIAATDDCTPDVRLAAIKAVEDSSDKACCQKCGSTSCCSEKVAKRLSEIAYEKDNSGCPLEPSAEIRQAAARALRKCCPNRGPVGPIEEDLPEPGPTPTPVPPPSPVIPGESGGQDAPPRGESADDPLNDLKSGLRRQQGHDINVEPSLTPLQGPGNRMFLTDQSEQVSAQPKPTKQKNAQNIPWKAPSAELSLEPADPQRDRSKGTTDVTSPSEATISKLSTQQPSAKTNVSQESGPIAGVVALATPDPLSSQSVSDNGMITPSVVKTSWQRQQSESASVHPKTNARPIPPKAAGLVVVPLEDISKANSKVQVPVATDQVMVRSIPRGSLPKPLLIGEVISVDYASGQIMLKGELLEHLKRGYPAPIFRQEGESMKELGRIIVTESSPTGVTALTINPREIVNIRPGDRAVWQ